MVVACGEHIIERDRTEAIEEACDMQMASGCCFEGSLLLLGVGAGRGCV